MTAKKNEQISKYDIIQPEKLTIIFQEKSDLKNTLCDWIMLCPACSTDKESCYTCRAADDDNLYTYDEALAILKNEKL